MYALRNSHTDGVLHFEAPTNRPSYISTSREERSTALVERRRCSKSADYRWLITTDFKRKRVSLAGSAQAPGDMDSVTSGDPITATYSDKDRLAARLRMLKRLPPNHDNEGAAAPIGASVDAALSFLPQFKSLWSYGVTLDDDGHAVIEFADRAAGKFAAITFLGHGAEVECYSRGGGAPPVLMTTAFDASLVIAFLGQSGAIA